MADYEDTYDYDEYEATNITPEDCWAVIASFFDHKGLASQQVGSFDEFTSVSVQHLVNEYSHITLDQPSPPSNDGRTYALRRYEVNFGRVWVSRPSITESDGRESILLPYECRDRNLTYATPLYIRITKKITLAVEHPIPLHEMDDQQRAAYAETQVAPTDIRWEDEDVDVIPDEKDTLQNTQFVGRIPVMVKSSICHLRHEDEDGLFLLNECPYDQGGYFIINGSEKVLIAQERSAANIVQVFKKAMPSPFSHTAEIRSALEKGSRLISQLVLRLYGKGGGRGGGGGAIIHVTLPYVRQETPIALVFRALGVVSDEDILNHVCYDRNDSQMLEMLKPCIEESFVVQDREVALDHIGRRGQQGGFSLTRDKRIRTAKEILQKETLPHISQAEGSETRKAFFIGYMVHKLLQCALGRRDVDDRDHFGKKRLDLAGPLLSKLFRNIMRRMNMELSSYMKMCIQQNRNFQISNGIRITTLTNGMKYSLATGNWGDQKKAMSSTAGVSQVLNRYTFASTLSHLRRTNTPIGRDGKLAKPRQLHNTHWGLVCPAETPEGQACGLVKNLSLMCFVSTGTTTEALIEYMIDREMEIVEEYDPVRFPNATKVFVNGVWHGIIQEPKPLVDSMIQARRTNLFPAEVSLVRDIRDREFKVFSDAGRVMRPVFVVHQEDDEYERIEKGTLAITKDQVTRLTDERDLPTNERTVTWEDLVHTGAVEYLDAEEEETAMICMTPEDLDEFRLAKAGIYTTENILDDPNKRLKTKLNPTTHTYTHCEIHPSMILGICASIIPFPDHNQVSPPPS
ncbi:hypothetical protein IMZ48_25855, partial [Candidatus Bathyarchaeota archaeon]|nr:hypothetical protein [Candidatus Bathyarchaeota archaeon]